MILAVGATKNRLISMTPLIDVVFILLLFFMLTSSFSRLGQLYVETSANPAPALNSDQALTRIWVKDTQTIQIDGQDYRLFSDAFMQALAMHDDPSVAIKVAAAPDVSVQALMTVIDALQQAGLEGVKLSESYQP